MRNIPVILVILVSLFLGTSVYASRDQHHPKHFVLVHGACLGAWSWYKIIPPLKSYGHNVTTIDLAASGINPLRVDELQSFSDYSKPLTDFMESLSSTERVILVGHSLGGAAISQAMELFPEKVSMGVFLTALMPGPSLPFSVVLQKSMVGSGSALDNKFNYDKGPNNRPTSFIIGPMYISQVVYQHSPPQDAALATMLVRPFPLTSGKELVFSKGKYGSVNRVFIISENDRVLTKTLQEWVIEKNPPNRVERIGGSDHMVMTSQPAQLLVCLLSVTQDLY